MSCVILVSSYVEDSIDPGFLLLLYISNPCGFGFITRSVMSQAEWLSPEQTVRTTGNWRLAAV